MNNEKGFHNRKALSNYKWICEISLDRNKARAEEIAYGYYYGEYGLPKSIINAAEWFDRWGTKEAYQMLAHIFRTDPVLGSEEDAQYYERLAEKEQR